MQAQQPYHDPRDPRTNSGVRQAYHSQPAGMEPPLFAMNGGYHPTHNFAMPQAQQYARPEQYFQAQGPMVYAPPQLQPVPPTQQFHYPVQYGSWPPAPLPSHHQNVFRQQQDTQPPMIPVSQQYHAAPHMQPTRHPVDPGRHPRQSTLHQQSSLPIQTSSPGLHSQPFRSILAPIGQEVRTPSSVFARTAEDARGMTPRPEPPRRSRAPSQVAQAVQEPRPALEVPAAAARPRKRRRFQHDAEAEAAPRCRRRNTALPRNPPHARQEQAPQTDRRERNPIAATENSRMGAEARPPASLPRPENKCVLCSRTFLLNPSLNNDRYCTECTDKIRSVPTSLPTPSEDFLKQCRESGPRGMRALVERATEKAEHAQRTALLEKFPPRRDSVNTSSPPANMVGDGGQNAETGVGGWAQQQENNDTGPYDINRAMGYFDRATGGFRIHETTFIDWKFVNGTFRSAGIIDMNDYHLAHGAGAKRNVPVDRRGNPAFSQAARASHEPDPPLFSDGWQDCVVGENANIQQQDTDFDYAKWSARQLTEFLRATEVNEPARPRWCIRRCSPQAGCRKKCGGIEKKSSKRTGQDQ